MVLMEGHHIEGCRGKVVRIADRPVESPVVERVPFLLNTEMGHYCAAECVSCFLQIAVDARNLGHHRNEEPTHQLGEERGVGECHRASGKVLGPGALGVVRSGLQRMHENPERRIVQTRMG